MVNKRLLIRNIISNHGEGTFFDKKEVIDLASNRGRAKLLKHICALGNSNPDNESYLIVGVSDEGAIVGTDYVDDSEIQNIVSSYIEHAPSLKYENITFPSLPKERSVGLLTIYPQSRIARIAKNIQDIRVASVFHRIGSNSEPVVDSVRQYPANKSIVDDLIRSSRITL